jgi:2-methylisocitrate lyase-like PEP mutase family enzyme
MGVVDRGEAPQRTRAAIEAASAAGILVLARTDARAVVGFDEALDRCRMFVDEGADIVFLEAPETEDEMARACRAIARPMMANVLSGGRSPLLPPQRLHELGYRLAVHPMVPFAAALHAMQAALGALRDGCADRMPTEASFETIKSVVGFPEYYALEARFADDA